MTDFLKELCAEHGVKPVYTNNKTTVLSSTTPQGKPNLRVHNLFRECPRDVAQAVFDHHAQGEPSGSLLAKLDRYVAAHSDKKEWRIEPCDLAPVTFAFTDKCGQFLFGVESEKVYVAKVFWFEPEGHQECMEDIFCDDPHQGKY